MKIPYDKNFKIGFLCFAGLLVIAYLYMYMINPDEFWIKPGNWATRNWVDFLLMIFPTLMVAFMFVYSYAWYEIDSDGIKIHRAFGKVILHKWSEFVYVGPTVIFGNSTHYKILTCTTKLPYKKYERSESYILSKDSLRFPRSEKIYEEALRKYCPNFSTEYENP